MAFPVLLIFFKKRKKKAALVLSFQIWLSLSAAAPMNMPFVIGDPVTRPPSPAVSISETEIRRWTCRGPTLDQVVQEGDGWVWVPARMKFPSNRQSYDTTPGRKTRVFLHCARQGGSTMGNTSLSRWWILTRPRFGETLATFLRINPNTTPTTSSSILFHVKEQTSLLLF